MGKHSKVYPPLLNGENVSSIVMEVNKTADICFNLKRTKQ